jgi:UDP-glucose 6-dehydrogenase
MTQREKQTEWLADIIIKNSNGKKVNILGKTFKAETNLELGSPSILLLNILLEKGINVNIWDPYIDGNLEKYIKVYKWDTEPQLFFIGTKHEQFNNFFFIKESVVIDPWRYIVKKNDIKLIRIGDSIFNNIN